MQNRPLITVVSHTHWDRTWYLPFQVFRVRLVRLIDRLIQLLEHNPDFPVFTLDGQMAVLEDYLEVRPQKREELVKLCQQGRLVVGPWYVLADEFLVHPEALIRNLALGMRLGRQYGGAAQIGYVPDGFGHIAQLPQILRGFGIDNAVFWRGLGNEGEQLGTEFNWAAPDGSSVLAIWLPWAYFNASNLGYPLQWGDTSQTQYDEDLALEQLHRAAGLLAPMANTPALLLMNGIDHGEADGRNPAVLKKANQVLSDGVFVQGTVADHIRNVRAANPNLAEFSGEFRWGKYSEILQGVYSTCMPVKQANQRVENLLLRYTEPLAAMAWQAGLHSPGAQPEGTQDLLRTAWRYLLQNHPHDDIYASTADVVNRESLHRYSQAEQIGQTLTRDSLRQIARAIDYSQKPGMPLLLYNPLAWERQEMVTASIDFDFDDPTADVFHLLDGENDRKVSFQVLDDRPVFWMETLKPNRKRRVTVAFPATLPACGYASYFVLAGDSTVKKSSDGWQVRKDGAENRYLSFQIGADGSLTITDKQTGQRFPNLNYFSDMEDAGDEYSYCPCLHSMTFSTRGTKAGVAIASQGPLKVTFKITHTLHLPQGLTEDRLYRSAITLEQRIISWVTLYWDQPGLFIETEIDNRASDHKLSVVFPAPFDSSSVFVDSSFAVVERSIDLPQAVGWVEDPTPLMHQRGFIDMNDGKHGLAIFNRGLPSVEAFRQDGHLVTSLTLLRCVGWLSRDDLATRRVAAGPLLATPEGQCQGTHHFEYAIYTHPDGWQAVYQAANNYLAPVMAVRADTHEGLNLHEMNISGDDPSLVKPIPWPREGTLPLSFSFIRSSHPGLVLSTFARAENGEQIVARFYNILPEPVTATISSGLELSTIFLADLKEDIKEPVALKDAHTFEISCKPHEIVTLLLKASDPPDIH